MAKREGKGEDKKKRTSHEVAGSTAPGAPLTKAERKRKTAEQKAAKEGRQESGEEGGQVAHPLGLG